MIYVVSSRIQMLLKDEVWLIYFSWEWSFSLEIEDTAGK